MVAIHRLQNHWLFDGVEDRRRHTEEVVGRVESEDQVRNLESEIRLSASGSFLVGQQDAFAALKPFKMKVAQQDGPFSARLLIYDRSWLCYLVASVDHA